MSPALFDVTDRGVAGRARQRPGFAVTGAAVAHDRGLQVLAAITAVGAMLGLLIFVSQSPKAMLVTPTGRQGGPIAETKPCPS